MRHPLFIVLLLLLQTNLHAANEDFLILETEANQKTGIGGNRDLMSQSFTPASTFKIILAWAGIEEGLVEPGTLHEVHDAHVPETPRRISLKDALFYSSNDYFIWLAEKLNVHKITRYIEKSEWMGKSVPENWLGNDPRAVVRAGTLKVTPLQQHQFIQKLMNGVLISGSNGDKLKRALEWPSSDPNVRLFGKTGSWGGVVWFNGFGESPKGKKAVTVLVRKSGAKRDDGIRFFYSAWDQSPPKL
jgi:beta-lactamase class D